MTLSMARREIAESFATGVAVRQACRTAAWSSATAGMAPGYVQANLVILPREFSGDFSRFCLLNRRPCPILAVGEPGSPRLPSLGADLDVRTDLPRYRIWRDGVLTDEPVSLTELWRNDLVAFAIGCSFSFEEALLAAGLPLRYVELGRNVPMYRTSMACVPAGPFCGSTVVSMRPFRPADAIRAIQITSRFPDAHGAPVHFGDPAAIGIADLGNPDFGECTPIEPGEVPLFWACGVTPQVTLQAARLPFVVTHAPGAMLVTDLKNAKLAVL
jgi:uncharacterized protein YcsI (UPF0317 family)